MTFVWDMGAHAPYVWLSYGAFALVFLGLVLWAARSGARARAELERREAQRKERR